VGFPEWTAKSCVWKTTGKGNSEACAIAFQNCAVYSVFRQIWLHTVNSLSLTESVLDALCLDIDRWNRLTANTPVRNFAVPTVFTYSSIALQPVSVNETRVIAELTVPNNSLPGAESSRRGNISLVQILSRF